jgi:hypothetical protein
MPNLIFLDLDSRVVGRAKSGSYSAASEEGDPLRVFVGTNWAPENMTAIYDRATGTYTSDEITEAHHNPPPPEPEPEQPAP